MRSLSLPAPPFFALDGVTSALPPPPGPLLLVVSGPHRDTLEACVSGYETVRWTPDEYLVLEPGDRPVRRFPAILIDWDGLDVSPLIPLNRGYDLLRETGRLIILIKHESNDEERAAGNRREAFYLEALAKHCGFAVHSAPAPSDASAAVLVFQKSRGLRWQVAEPESEHVPGLIALFRKSFDAEMSPEFWNWKYGEGRGRAIIARRGGEIIAHYGGTTRRIWFRGQTLSALEICDVMVAPKERGVMTKQGAFFHVASVFLETFFGYRQEHFLAYGFPNHRHMRVAERLGLYGEVERVAEIRWAPLHAPPQYGATSLLDLVNHPDIDGVVGSLWELMQKDLPDAIAVIRDPLYLRYRYLLNPHHAYDILTVLDRSTDCSRGLVVLRRDKEECKLLDIVAPLKEIPLLIDHVRRQIAHWGLSGVTAWITVAYAALFVNTGGQQLATEVCIPTNVLTEGPSVRELKGRWWLMMGDTEFL
ncbi:MAG: GNAT family N-acetyltransferase [Methylococcales bacterium]